MGHLRINDILKYLIKAERRMCWYISGSFFGSRHLYPAVSDKPRADVAIDSIAQASSGFSAEESDLDSAQSRPYNRPQRSVLGVLPPIRKLLLD